MCIIVLFHHFYNYGKQLSNYLRSTFISELQLVTRWAKLVIADDIKIF